LVGDRFVAAVSGICNYYGMESNFCKLSYFAYLMEYSCLKTLANKHKSSISKIVAMFKDGNGFPGGTDMTELIRNHSQNISAGVDVR
jgi:hypothetical protein